MMIKQAIPQPNSIKPCITSSHITASMPPSNASMIITTPITVMITSVFTPLMLDNANANRKNTVPIFEKWVRTKPNEL